MSHFNQSVQSPGPVTDPYTDPVSYLAALGVEAELVEVITPLTEAA
jgi:hypothetical protein